MSSGGVTQSHARTHARTPSVFSRNNSDFRVFEQEVGGGSDLRDSCKQNLLSRAQLAVFKDGMVLGAPGPDGVGRTGRRAGGAPLLEG